MSGPDYELLLGVSGVGQILALTILYETEDIKRCFAAASNYASSCRCVDSRRMSHGKKKREGNKRNGNRKGDELVHWAGVESRNPVDRIPAGGGRTGSP